MKKEKFEWKTFQRTYYINNIVKPKFPQTKKSLKLNGIKNFYRDNYFKYQEVIDKHGK